VLTAKAAIFVSMSLVNTEKLHVLIASCRSDNTPGSSFSCALYKLLWAYKCSTSGQTAAGHGSPVAWTNGRFSRSRRRVWREKCAVTWLVLSRQLARALSPAFRAAI